MTLPRSAVPRPPPDLDQLGEWLRAGLHAKLGSLRAGGDGARAELDVLLGPAARDPASAPPIPAALAALGERLRLRDDELRITAVLLACALEPALGRALGLLCDPLGRPSATREAVAAIVGLPREHRLTAEDATTRWSVITRVEHGLALDPAIEARLLGRNVRDGNLVEHLAIIPVRAPLPDWPVDAIADQVHRAVEAGARSVRIWLRGPDGSGRRTLFAAVASRVGLVAAELIADATRPDVVRAALRLARLEDLALIWSDRVRLPIDLAPPTLQGWLEAEAPPPCAGVADLIVAIPVPDREARRSAWHAIVPAFRTWPAASKDALVAEWSSRPGQLSALALTGPMTVADAQTRLRAHAAQQLERHCELLDTPFTWDDLVAPASLSSALHEIAGEARALPALWEEPEIGRLFPHGRAITALFSGTPGTGKTMAAQIIARELGLPLFRIDLSRIVSKYVGETSQNLARVLGAARHTDAVVFFDEADAIFGKRTDISDAHDRYANTETDYLLQALDAWPGVALLATNKRGNIDPAFMRRMRSIVEFPRPDAADRQRMWSRLAAALLGPRAEDLAPAIARAGATIESSGAQIKGALLTARAIALGAGTPVSIDHVMRGIERELDKEGRGLTARDRLLLVTGQA